MTSMLMCNGLLEVWEDGTVYRIKNGTKEKATIFKAGTAQYCMVSRTENGKQKNSYVHRLVAQAFIPNPLNLRQVNHKDGNNSNNNVNNLEWTSSSENVKKAYQTALTKSNPCLRCGEPTLVKDGVCTHCKNELKKESNKEDTLAEIKDLMGSLNLSILSENQRKYVSRRKEGLNYAEIAKLYGVSRQAVEQAIKIAILKSDKPIKEDRIVIQRIQSLKTKIQKKKLKIDCIQSEICLLECQLEKISRLERKDEKHEYKYT